MTQSADLMMSSMRSQTLKLSRIHARRQFSHFLLSAVLPLAAVVIWLFRFPPPTMIDVGLLLSFWFWVGCLGISVGFHRYFTHRAFQASTTLQWVMAVAGSMAMQGPLVYWVSLHRSHHQHSDAPSDPHSPQTQCENASRIQKLRSFMNGHVGWVARHGVPSPKYFAADVRKSEVAQRVSRGYWAWVLVGVILPGIIAFAVEPTVERFLAGVVYGGFLRIVAVNHTTWAVNSVCHCFGSRAFATTDESRNNFLISIPSSPTR